MILISFSGLDGSGKTEQIARLVRYLKKNQLRYKLIHIVQNSIANRFSGRKAAGRHSQTSAGFAGILARKIALLIDILLFRISLVTMRKYDIIIADRYFYDYLVNIYYLAENQDPHVPPFLLHLIPRPDLSFYLSVDPKTAHQRKADQGIAYLEAKHQLFEKLKKRLKLTEIGDDKIENIANTIASNIERKLISRKL